ncbi:MAG: polyhydroxyalkanoate synthesis regulator DNA-binding domain-containing protein [Sandaracinaceae bacterium]|nr:polyhydroxyalkanoate synthesis regulator DNA-binding domain-containing protein [Sandaracinaceae bacterium]
MVVKKYGNRRLYDTDESRYITLEELAARIRAGSRVQVVDAKSNQDLTQQTLAHIILESRGASKLLPVPLLEQLIRMGDGALAEFFGLYVSTALEMYLQAKANAQAMLPYGNPFLGMPMAASSAFSRMMNPWGAPPVPAQPPPAPYPPAPDPTASAVAELRRELAELRAALRAAPPPDDDDDAPIEDPDDEA